MDGVNAKNLDLSEFATNALHSFSKFAELAYYDQHYESGLKIVGLLCKVIEGKKTRMVKYAQPALLQIKQTVGDDKLEAMILTSFNKVQSGTEEAKEDGKNSQRAKLLIDGLEPKNSKADKSKDFRSFLKNQKTEPTKEAELEV